MDAGEDMNRYLTSEMVTARRLRQGGDVVRDVLRLGRDLAITFIGRFGEYVPSMTGGKMNIRE